MTEANTPARLGIFVLLYAVCAASRATASPEHPFVAESHIQSGTGTLEDPLIVTRDNPHFEGWFHFSGIPSRNG